MPRRRRLLTCVLAVCALAAAGCEGTGATASGSTSSADLISAQPSYPGAAITINGCTAARVGPRHILTAAHCVVGEQGLGPRYRAGASFEISNEPSMADPHWRSVTVAKTTVDPTHAQAYATCFAQRAGAGCGYINQLFDGADWALIETQEDLGSIPIAPVDLDPVEVGDQVVLAGYGCTLNQADPTVFRAEYATVVPIREAMHSGSQLHDREDVAPRIDADYVVTKASARGGPGLCPGDSGGPVFRDGAVVGVNASYTFDGSPSPVTNWHTRLGAGTRLGVGEALKALGARTCSASAGDCGYRRTSAGRLEVMGKCLGTVGASTQNGTPIELSECDDSDRQAWVLLGERIFIHSSGRCLDQSWPASEGEPLILWDCHFGYNQRFALQGGAALSTAGLCVDVDVTSARAQLWGCHGGSNQRVSFLKKTLPRTLEVMGKCLAPTLGRTENGTPIELVDCDGSPWQEWTLHDGRVLIHDSGRCLDQAWPATQGQPLVLWDCHLGKNQQLVPKNGVAMSPTNLCLDVDVPTGRAQMWGCHGGENQKVAFTR